MRKKFNNFVKLNNIKVGKWHYIVKYDLQNETTLLRWRLFWHDGCPIPNQEIESYDYHRLDTNLGKSIRKFWRWPFGGVVDMKDPTSCIGSNRYRQISDKEAQLWMAYEE